MSHFSFFFLGVPSIRMFQTILAHSFCSNIARDMAKKGAEYINFWMEIPKALKRFWVSLVITVPRVLKRFWLSLAITALCVITVVVLSTKLVPTEWRAEKSSCPHILPLMYVLPVPFDRA
jgi:hypothetical protein